MKKEDSVDEFGTKLARKGMIYVGGDALSTIVTLFAIILLARLLNSTAFGAFSVAVAYFGILGIFSNFGMGTAFRKMLPRSGSGKGARANAILSGGYIVALAVALVIAVVGILASQYLATSIYHSPGLAPALQIASAAELLYVLYNLTLAALVGIGRVWHATQSNLGYAAVYLVGSVGLVLAGQGVYGAVLGMTLGLAVGFVIGAYHLVRDVELRIVRPGAGIVRELTSFSAPVVTSHVAEQGGLNLAVLVLGVYAPLSIVGNYGAAYRLARFINIAVTDIGFVLLPAFSSAFANKNTAGKIGSIYNYSIYYSALLILPVVAYCAAASGPLMRILIGGSYTYAPLYFSVMVVGMALAIIGTFAGNLILGYGDAKKFMKYQVGAVILQVVLLLALTPYLQATGVLLSIFVITPIVLDVAYIIALERQFPFRHSYRMLAGVMTASIIVFTVAYAASVYLGEGYAALVVDAVAVLLLFPPLASAMGGIHAKQLDFIRRAAGGIPQLLPIAKPIISYASIFVKD